MAVVRGKPMKHYPKVEVVRSVAAKGYGASFPSEEAAEKALIDNPTNLTASALLEIVRRLNQVASAFARDEEAFKNKLWNEKYDERPEYAIPFPGAKIGDILYSCEDLEDGVGRDVVVEVCKGDYVLTVSADLGDTTDAGLQVRRPVSWGSKYNNRTRELALKYAAEHDIEYHGKRHKLALRVVEAIHKGEDLTEFIAGVDVDEDEGEDSP
jgi:hypothetical protein